MPAGRSGTIGAAGLVRLRYAVGPPRSAPDSAERVMQPFPAVGEPSLDSRRLIAAADRPEEAVEGVSPDAGGEQVENEPRVQKGIVHLNARQRRFLCCPVSDAGQLLSGRGSSERRSSP